MPLNLERIRPHLLATKPADRRRDLMSARLDELHDWIAAYGRAPQFSFAGKTTENVLALRYHACAVVQAHLDGTASPPNPLAVAAPARRRRPVRKPASVVCREWDQTFWAEGAR